MSKHKFQAKKGIKISIKQVSLIIFLVFGHPILLLAQDPGGGPDAPIDGGLSILLAAGAAYGVKKYRDIRKVKEMEK